MVAGPVNLCLFARPREAICRQFQPEVLAQGLAFVFLTKQLAPLKFGRYLIYEVLASTWQMAGSDVEAVTSLTFEPILHNVDNVLRGPNQAETAHAGDLLIELANGRLLPPDPLPELLAEAADASWPQRVDRHRFVERIT